MISARQLPTGVRPTLAADVSPANRDLGLRMLNRSPEVWFALILTGTTLELGAGGPPARTRPKGNLQPILVDGLGAPVVAVWTSPTEDQRWYIIPDVADWNGLLDWAVSQTLPTYVPGALRRARSPQLTDPELQTDAELAANQALVGMTERHAAERAKLEAELETARGPSKS